MGIIPGWFGEAGENNFSCCYHQASPDSNAVRVSQISFTVIRGKRKAETGQTPQSQGPQSKNSVLRRGRETCIAYVRSEC